MLRTAGTCCTITQVESIGLADLRKRLGIILAKAEHGEPITVLRNGRPIVRIVPIASPQETPEHGEG
jgi:prevent-host-death family protein